MGRATRFQTSRNEDKRIKLGNPAPPTPTKMEIIKLERARRGANPTCLHFEVEKEVREYLYPDHYFCAHCDDYVEAMIHSMNKKAIKRDSRTFSCQGGHTNFITPTTLKQDKLYWRLFTEDADANVIQEEEDLEDEEMSVMTAPRTVARTAGTRNETTVTPAESTVGTPTTNETMTAHNVTPAVSTPANRNLQADYDDLLGKDAQNTDKLLELRSQLSELSKKLEDPRRLQQKYNDLFERHQSLILQTMDPKGLVSRAINLPFDAIDEFDGSDAVIDDTLVKKQKKLTKFVTMLTQSKFLDGLVRTEILKQAKSIIREEQYTPWKIMHLKESNGGNSTLAMSAIRRNL